MANYLSKVVGNNAVGRLDRCAHQSALLATSGVWGTPGEHRMIERSQKTIHRPTWASCRTLETLTFTGYCRDGWAAPKARRHLSAGINEIWKCSL